MAEDDYAPLMFDTPWGVRHVIKPLTEGSSQAVSHILAERKLLMDEIRRLQAELHG